MQTAIYIKMYTSLPNLLFNIKACHHAYVHIHMHTHTRTPTLHTHKRTHTHNVHTHTEEQKGGKEKQMGGEVGGDEKVRL